MKKTPTKIGRPRVITDAVVQKLEEAFRDGMTVYEACLTSGISRSTLYEHMHESKDFSDRMVLAQEYISFAAKRVLRKEIEAGNVKMAQYWLEQKDKNEFGANASYDHARDRHEWRRKNHPTPEEISLDKTQRRRDQDFKNILKSLET